MYGDTTTFLDFFLLSYVILGCNGSGQELMIPKKAFKKVDREIKVLSANPALEQKTQIDQ